MRRALSIAFLLLLACLTKVSLSSVIRLDRYQRERSECGVRGGPSNSKKEIDGHPWIVALLDDDAEFFCSATLISSSTVITCNDSPWSHKRSTKLKLKYFQPLIVYFRKVRLSHELPMMFWWFLGWYRWKTCSTIKLDLTWQSPPRWSYTKSGMRHRLIMMQMLLSW